MNTQKNRGYFDFWRISFKIPFTKHKFLETYCLFKRDWFAIFNLDTHLRLHSDKAGFYFFLSLFKIWFSFDIFDERRWDDDKNTWINNGDIQKKDLTNEEYNQESLHILYCYGFLKLSPKNPKEYYYNLLQILKNMEHGCPAKACFTIDTPFDDKTTP